jgi:hypothetical protein
MLLPWHEPLPLSKAACMSGWRFMGKLFFGLGFAATQSAGQCSGYVRAVIAASATAARSVGGKRVAGSIVRRIGVISRASRVVWIIATVNVPIVAGDSQPA